MDTNKIKNTILSAGLFVIACLAISTPSRAQSPSPTPSTDANNGRYNIVSSVEFGGRGLAVNGDTEKYRSDLNYRAGVRIFDSSFLMEDKGSGAKLFDTAFMSASGWGGDPSGSFRLNMSRTGIYKFESNVRRVHYYNDLKNFANTWTQTIPNQSQHQFDTKHHFGDFDLTIFPERDLRFKLGYSFNNTDGPGFYTIRFPAFEAGTIPGTTGTRGDEYQVNTTWRSNSQDLRAGVEGKLLGFNLGITYGHRMFHDKTRYYLNSFSLGNDPTVPTVIGPTTSVSGTANLFTRTFPTKGATDYFNFYLQRTFARKFDLVGRFIYAESRSNVDQQDTGSGTSSGSSLSNRSGQTCSVANPAGCVVSGTARVFFDIDNVFVTGKVKRPQSRGDLGLTYRVTEHFRISNTFTFDQYSIGGSNNFLENMQGRSFATAVTGFTTAIPFNTISNTAFTEGTNYRRFTNTIEGDYQVNSRLGFNIGYRYGNRRVTLAGFEQNLVSGAVLEGWEPEEFTNHTHSVIAGARFKPIRDWSIFADLEGGQADNPFTRLSNNDYFYARVRSITRMKQVTFNLSGVIRNNNNPGQSLAASPFPNQNFTASVRSRYFAGSVDWAPKSNYSFSVGYTYNHLTSGTDIIVPVGVPVFGSTSYYLGRSEYYSRDNYFHFDVYARPIKWMSAYISYRIDDDKGQGDRRITRPQDIITSYPMTMQAPEVRLAFRLTKNIDWNVGYQYYDYKETNFVNPFMTTSPAATASNRILIPQLVPNQNYSAHLPYMSLRVHWGGTEDVR